MILIFFSLLCGILLKCFSVFVFMMMVVLVKVILQGDVGILLGQQVFFWLLFVIFVILIWLLMWGELVVGLKIYWFMGYFYCGIVGMVVMVFGFWVLVLLFLFEVMVIGYVVLLLIVIFVVMFLGEQVWLFWLSMVGFGLVGVLIVLLFCIGYGCEVLDVIQ